MERIKKITPIDREAVRRSSEKWNRVAKPLHSLGKTEELIKQMAGIFGSENFDISKRCAVCMCADNGVVAEGVTQTDSSVTAAVAKAMAEGTSNINILCDLYGADVFPVDIGICTDVKSDNIIMRKIACGTENITKGAAMTREMAEKAIVTGMNMVRDLKEKGYKLIITGEMGIGNTTTSSAVASVITGLSPEITVGRGAGLDDSGLERKINAVKKAIEINRPDSTDGVDILAKVGGFDIGGIAGLFLGGGYYHIPIIADGFISLAAAAVAYKINPLSREYMIPSHRSSEPAVKALLDHLDMSPVIDGGLHLGEGTGGAMLLPVLDGAAAIYNSAHSFENLNMEQYKEL